MTFRTIKDCEDAINAILAIGQQPDPDWYNQLATLKAAAGIGGPTSPIYSHLKTKMDSNGNLWFSTELQDCIEDTVQKLMNPTGNFSPKDPGLLLGKIQSGKTRAFVGIIGLMFDKDIDIAIVLTKGTKALAQQTKTRMEDEFSAFSSRRVPGRPHVDVSDILNRRNGYSVRELNDKNIIICKKEKNNMAILNEIAHINGFDQKKILIVDDEADFASRNYKRSGGIQDLAAIATAIDNLA